MECKYVKPLTNTALISDFFSGYDVDVPQGFSDFFVANNGGRPESNECSTKDGSERIVNNFLSFNMEDKENVYKAARRVAEDNDKLIPFAKDPGGDYFCLLDNKVVIWSHEDGGTIDIADTFKSFCTMLN